MGRRDYLKLHGGELVEHVGHGISDDVPGDFVVGLRRGLHRVSRHVLEGDDVAQHPRGLVERAEPVVSRVAAGELTLTLCHYTTFATTW